MSSRPPRVLIPLAMVVALVWGAVFVDALWGRFLEFRYPAIVAATVQWAVFTAAAGVAVAGVWLSRKAGPVRRWAIVTAGYVPVWHWLVFTCDALRIDLLRSFFAQAGLWGLFLLGLGWVIWWLERWAEHYRRQKGFSEQPRRIWNPLNPEAWYYGRQSRKLTQSLVAGCSYALAFLLGMALFSQLRGCSELYEMPGGGGGKHAGKNSSDTPRPQTVKIQKVVRKKLVVNPFSLIKFNPPAIDQIQLHVAEETAHLYKVGQGGAGIGDGEGDGAGFSGGTGRGKVRFIRVEYQGGDWDQDFGVGADLNMLIQYGVLTSHKVADQTESRSIGQLRNFPLGKSPPFLYLTGQRNVTLSASEAKILREYLLDKHGMLFVDNGGSYHFHTQVLAAMQQVLPHVEPVKVPLDDVIHRVPFEMPYLPYVAPHGGKDALGWKVDGRWVVYYHPGDIGDAWSDGHSAVPKDVWQACYQLGTNVIYYAHAEYNQWLQAQKRR